MQKSVQPGAPTTFFAAETKNTSQAIVMSNVTLPRHNIFHMSCNTFLALVALSASDCRDRHGEDLPDEPSVFTSIV